MTKSESKKKVTDYLTNERIQYRFLNESSGLVSLDDVDTLYLSCETKM